MTDSHPTAVAAPPPPELIEAQSPEPRWAVERGEDGYVVVRGAGTPSSGGDPEPGDWRERLAWFLRTIPGVKLVGAKRYFADGHVFSMGEHVVHPKGFHHLGKGVAGACYRFPEEVDAIAGGVMLVDEVAFDEADGEAVLDEMGQLGALALGLAIRQRGGRVLGIPQVGVVDEFSPSLDDAESAAFRERFGFDWVAPDLDVVRKEHAADACGNEGGGLLWNAFHHAGMMPFNKYDTRGALVWQGYQSHDPLKQRCDHLARLTAKFSLPPEGSGGITLDVGCGDGLFSHLFAQLGCNVVGIDPEPEGVAQATKMCESQHYPDPQGSGGGAPEFRVGRGDDIPFDNQTIGCVTLFDVIEHLNNPIGVLREIDRVLQPGGTFICVTPAWQFGGNSDPAFHGYEFTQEELNRMINAAPGLQVVHNGQIGGVYRDLIAIAKKS